MAANIAMTTQPPTALFRDSHSDDEESFVVLGTSLPSTPTNSDSYIDKEILDKPIDGSIVDEALNLVQAHLSTLSDSTSSFPSIPRVSEQDMESIVERLHFSTVTNSSVDLSPDEIQQKVDLLVDENIKLKETLHQNNMAMKHQYKTLVLWQEDVLKVHQSHKEKFAETKKYIENLKIENAQLTQALALEQSKSSKCCETANVEVHKSPSVLINTNMTEFELETAKKKIATLEMEIKVLQDEKIYWENSSQLQNSFRSQAEDLQKELDKTKQINAQDVAGYIKQVQQFESLQKILLDEVKMLKTKTSDHSHCIKQEQLDNIQEQLMAAQMHITKLEQLTQQDKEIINDKATNISKLLLEIQEQKDTISALQAQLDLYKSDFESEQQLRITITAEKEQIADDLQQLQRRNNHLLQEVEHLRTNDFVHVERLEQATVSNSTPSAPEQSPQLASSYNCPLCMARFNLLHILEEHVEYCINNTP